MKKMFFKITFRECQLIEEEKIINNSYNEGYVAIVDDQFIGYMTLDYIEGDFEDGVLSVDILDFQNEKGFIFEYEIDDFTLPNKFYLFGGDESSVYILEFVESVKDVTFQNQITENIMNVAKLHNIPEE